MESKFECDGCGEKYPHNMIYFECDCNSYFCAKCAHFIKKCDMCYDSFCSDCFEICDICNKPVCIDCNEECCDKQQKF